MFIEFVIPSEGHDYTYLPLTRLEGEIKITNDNSIQSAKYYLNNISFILPTFNLIYQI